METTLDQLARELSTGNLIAAAETKTNSLYILRRDFPKTTLFFGVSSELNLGVHCQNFTGFIELFGKTRPKSAPARILHEYACFLVKMNENGYSFSLHENIRWSMNLPSKYIQDLSYSARELKSFLEQPIKQVNAFQSYVD